MARIPFKQRSSPVKGKLQNFFSSLGENLQRNKRDIGADLKEKYNRTKESTPKAGESQYQADVRTRRATKKSKPGEFTTKQKLEGKLVPNQELMNKKVKSKAVEDKKVKVVKKQSSKAKVTSASGSKTRKEQYDAKGWKYDDTIKGYNRDGTRKNFTVQTSVQANKEGVMTPQTAQFNTKAESDAYIAANKGSFGYKTDKEGNRIKKNIKLESPKISDSKPKPGDREMPIASSKITIDNGPQKGKYYDMGNGKIKMFDGVRYTWPKNIS
tara:strand:+ start:105 stop:911 length:807 start_codon:yes stop_codon:yes gene_type:complete